MRDVKPYSLTHSLHMRCLRKIAGIKWQDRVPNTEVLRLCGISGIEAVLLAAQLRWVGHVVRMDDKRIPKQIFFGQLSSGKRPQCGPLRRYKDTVKVNTKRCGLQPKSLSTAALDRAQWRTTCQSAIEAFDETPVAELDRKRAAGKQQAVNIIGTAWPCDRCNKICSSRIGLFAHRRCTPCMCLCVCLSAKISSEPQARSLPIFLCSHHGSTL